ncbi:MAG: FAD-dependent oxidoreductase [Hyphomicrobiales bacterium]|nr:FAD-dependent oxidoreductase [Hyphomicrobiales bacterium]
MISSDRRRFLKGSAALLAAALPVPALAQAKPKVVVVGGGPGGATIAKYLAKDSNGAIEVTLVEPLRQFVTCFHSNLYLGGFRDLPSITHSYDALASKYGTKLVHQAAQGIDREKKAVRLADGSQLAYDRLVVAPGIDIKFDSVPGYSEAAAEVLPHAWKPGAQTQLLKRQLDAVADGETIVMIAPPNPYRCPPGPYERVSMMAHVLKAKGNRRARIIVLDPKDNFSKQALFQEGWEKHYPGMVEWQDPKMHGGIKRVDPATKTVETDLATYKAALVNVIPAQMAGKIARDAGLANQSGFCPIDPTNMKSSNDPNIYVVGDACIAGDMPKSAFSANSQAKVAALMIRGELTDARTFPARYTNTCWSLIETDDTVKVGGRYEPKDGKIAAVETFVSKTGESADLRRQTQVENMGWYAGITADVFS